MPPFSRGAPEPGNGCRGVAAWCGGPGRYAAVAARDRSARADGDPAEAAAGAVRLALLPDDGPTAQFLSWDGTPVPW